MKKLLGSISLLALGIVSIPAQAAIHQDSHGNVGYDSLAECQEAVNSGTAKFYRSSTFHKPLLRAGETAVTKGRLGDLAPQYSRGTCDLGSGRRGGRDGVATALQGKYVPYSPDMIINKYVNSKGSIVRVSMAQCDNWFSGPVPRAMPTPAPVVQAPTPPPKPMPKPVPKPVKPLTVLQPISVPKPVIITAPATPIPAVNAAVGSLPSWAPLAAAAIIGIAIAASGDDDSSSSTGTTGTK